jgi:hypothetical protein
MHVLIVQYALGLTEPCSVIVLNVLKAGQVRQTFIDRTEFFVAHSSNRR